LPARLRLALVVLILCIGAIVLTTALARTDRHVDLTGGFAGAVRPASIPPDDFSLLDQDGQRVRLSSYSGQVVIVSFMYSTCQDTCPVMAQQIRGALDQLGRSVPTLAVSVDPRGDTPLHARNFLAKQSLTGRMHFLLGGFGTLQPIWRAFGIQPQGPGRGPAFDHSAYVIVIDRQGRQRIGFPSDQLTPEGLAHDVRKLEAEPMPARLPPRVQL
jgi:protein SCO1